MLPHKIYNLYKKNGILVRGNDGQQPFSNCDVLQAISNIKLSDTNCLQDFLENQSPPYSASLLSGVCNNPPILWYNFDYVEAFPEKTVNPIGNRTIVAVIFNNKKIIVQGSSAWDADSNLRNLGTIPNTPVFNKTTPASLFAELSVFDGIGGFNAPKPSSNNNNPTFNPLFLPKTNTSIADNQNDVDNFLCLVGKYKSTWVETLKNDAGGYNNQFGEYLTTNYGTGLEPEVLVEPKNEQDYYKKRFNVEDILCVAFITDNKNPNLNDRCKYYKKKIEFLTSATSKDGWLNPSKKSAFNKIPMVSISNVALPNVPLSGTSTTTGNVGIEWTTYLNDGYSSALNCENFKKI